jgi:DUF1365 family protein
MSPAACLYLGHTVHQRLAPRPHKFSYGVFQLLLDVDRLDQAFQGLKLIRNGRFGLFSFAEQDHGARDGSPIRPWVLNQLEAAGLTASAATIRLLCFPRILGFVFNPLSILFVEDADGRLEAVIYEVCNTFGQSHAYVVPANGDGEVHRQSADKAFYVSPFWPVAGGYRFWVTRPEDRFDLTIVKQTEGRADFVAKLSARRKALTDRCLLSLSFTMPLMTLGVVAAIHWEALRLWIKGAPVWARPAGPKAGMSVGRADSAS